MAVDVGVRVEAGVGVVVTPWTGVDVVEVGVAEEIGVRVEAGDGVVVTPWTGVKVGEALGIAELDEETSGDTSSAGVAWGALQPMRNSSVMCSAEISIGRINVMAVTNVTDCK